MSQPKLHWSAYLWPGLPQLWARGSWAGLALAVGFTALANVLIATTLVWDEWLPMRARWIGLAVAATVWTLAWFEGRADWRRLVAEVSGRESLAPPTDEQQDLWFRDAQRAYLAGDWVAAEQKLVQLVRRDSQDVEARLLLATLWRHEGRADDARRELERLSRMEAAAAWADEVAAEFAQLEKPDVIDSDISEPQILPITQPDAHRQAA